VDYFDEYSIGLAVSSSREWHRAGGSPAATDSQKAMRRQSAFGLIFWPGDDVDFGPGAGRIIEQDRARWSWAWKAIVSSSWH